jgi:hypothetical protein
LTQTSKLVPTNMALFNCALQPTHLGDVVGTKASRLGPVFRAVSAVLRLRRGAGRIPQQPAVAVEGDVIIAAAAGP